MGARTLVTRLPRSPRPKRTLVLLARVTLSVMSGLLLSCNPLTRYATPTPTQILPTHTPTSAPPPTSTATPAPTSTLLPTPTWTPTRTPAPTFTATAVPVPSATVKEDDTNLRQGPGRNYPVIKVLKAGTSLTALERTADSQWFRVTVDGTDLMGWVSVTVIDVHFRPDSIPTATEIPPTPTKPPAAPSPTPGTGPGAVDGRIVWNGQPFPDVTVKLCSDWHMFGGCKGTEYKATSGPDGRYSFAGVNPGKYSLVTQLPGQGNESMWLGRSVELQAGQMLTLRDLPVVRYDLQLNSPSDKAIVPVKPTLAWQAYPGTASYEVYVSGKAGAIVVSFEKVTGTQYAFGTALAPGEYLWGIYANNSAGTRIAEAASLRYFTVASP
jgi:hypothetical protein